MTQQSDSSIDPPTFMWCGYNISVYVKAIKLQQIVKTILKEEIHIPTWPEREIKAATPNITNR